MKLKSIGYCVRIRAHWAIIPLSLLGCGTACAALQAPPESVHDVSYRNDPDLLARINFTAVARPIDEVLGMIAKATGVRLTLQPDVAKRDITVFATNITVRQAMAAIARTTGFTWDTVNSSVPDSKPDRGSAAPAAYELRQTSTAPSIKAAAMRESEQREEALRAAQHDAMIAAIDRATTSGKPGALSAMLQGLSDDDKDQIADTSSRPTGVISRVGMPARLRPHEEMDGPRLLLRDSTMRAARTGVEILIVDSGQSGTVTSAFVPTQIKQTAKQ